MKHQTSSSPADDATNSSKTNNQEILNSGCVCPWGCDSCARLAESWEAMRQVALAVVSYDNFVNTFPQNRFSVASAQAIIERYENMRDKARAALALAARVKEAKHGD